MAQLPVRSGLSRAGDDGLSGIHRPRDLAHLNRCVAGGVSRTTESSGGSLPLCARTDHDCLIQRISAETAGGIAGVAAPCPERSRARTVDHRCPEEEEWASSCRVSRGGTGIGSGLRQRPFDFAPGRATAHRLYKGSRPQFRGSSRSWPFAIQPGRPILLKGLRTRGG